VRESVFKEIAMNAMKMILTACVPATLLLAGLPPMPAPASASAPMQIAQDYPPNASDNQGDQPSDQPGDASGAGGENQNPYAQPQEMPNGGENPSMQPPQAAMPDQNDQAQPDANPPYQGDADQPPQQESPNQ
jgi:hypothetical protein